MSQDKVYRYDVHQATISARCQAQLLTTTLLLMTAVRVRRGVSGFLRATPVSGSFRQHPQRRSRR